MKVNTAKPFTMGRPPLPEPPFCVRLASPNDWYKLLDDYPELERSFEWMSEDPLRENNYKYCLCRYFHTDGRATASELIDGCASTEKWPVVEYEG